ncbi:protein HESO1-like isoform X1 [Juglans microcarpa x Juglans regia]|uniref:protein HESO1-like isoform X1 n=1 Tax=Juglans microcarpa x Juglans regia TaxID=2249226 RepID=UPI001B7ED246|nr:protein HESO1-like isoform X1 [Juglans microcarpa x Juglans regia]XP_040999708.1 protein HESO1-like isoform X1 [Juglans microcarpa x Juglans regia]XP_040999782.1 protein HESO1-like isoform X1 [Juglans microcarpa x Juglans regia]
MGANSALEHVLKEILQVVQPLHEDQEKRYRVIDELRRVIESVESLRGATVEPFGSFVSSLFTRWGDLDISIDLPNGSYISSAGKKRRKKLLGDVQIALRQRGGWRKLQLIPNARVPILKFESSRQSISCDMSIDNIQGQMKSKLLFWVSAIDGRFHNMVLLVKEWAKAHGINNPKAGTFNSYSLCLLVIFHFQTCVPAILPPLKDIYPGNLVDDLQGVRTNAEIRIKEICAANIRRFRQDRFRRVNRSSLSELFTSFLEKFFDIGLKASELGIYPYTGQWERIDSNMRWYPKTYTILIEDPFEQPENSARAVNMSKLTLISEAFQTTYRRLISANQNKGSLVAALVRPEVSQSIIPRPRVWNPTHNGGHHQSHPTRPQVHRSLHSISQAQHQFQNLRLGSRSNIITLQNHNQGQQMRRPRFDGYIG